MIDLHGTNRTTGPFETKLAFPRSFPMTLTKDKLIQTLYDQAGFSKQKARTTVETVFELVKKTLESGEDVLISGFGKFSVKKKAPRKGRNPATGEDLPLDARTVITFRCSPVMRERVNGERVII
jgi:integration host factor subunit alpha